MKTVLFLSSIILTASAFATAGPSRKCNATMVKALLNDGQNICGNIHPSEDESNVFYATFISSEGPKPKQYKDGLCNLKEVDDGLPTMKIVVKPLSNGDCKIVSMEDQGV